jgi:hypothetical protein
MPIRHSTAVTTIRCRLGDGTPSRVGARYHTRSDVAGRASAVLREQFEAAKQHAELHGSVALIVEVRANVDLAIRVTRERLVPIRQSIVASTGGTTTAANPGLLSEEAFLEDELAELTRLREHMRILLGTVGR